MIKMLMTEIREFITWGVIETKQIQSQYELHTFRIGGERL
jgi:hypothetical protein